jgi:hypothetical protein
MRRAAIVIATLLACGSVHLQAQSTRRPNTREGFWIGFGLGDGSAGLDCTTCSNDRFGGFSGYFRLGGTLSRSVLLGFESNAWVHSEGGTDESIGFGSIVALWYPSRTGALYLKFGLGGMTYRADDGVDIYTATAPSASLGIGYEVRLGRNFSVLPFLNSLASSAVVLHVNGMTVPVSEDISFSLVQFGVGATWH